MGFFDRMEGKLERAYNGVFAKAFRAEVQPVEIASAIRRAMDDKAAAVGKGVALVPNVFTIELSETDYERLGEFSDDLNEELIAAAEEHADSQHYRPSGPLSITLIEDVDLETGVFRVRPASAKRPDATGYTGSQPPVRPERPSRDVRPADPLNAAPSAPAAASASSTGPDDGYDDYDDYADEGYADGDDAQDEDYDDYHEAYAAPPPGPPAPPAPPAPPTRDPRQRAVPPPPVAPAAPPPPPPRKVKPADRPWFDVDGDRYLLVSARNIIGRDESADVGLDDPGISRRHAEVRVTIDGPHFVTAIRDLGSTNGTFVNGERITTAHLQDGDRVTVGRTTMTYRVRR